ncbi:cytochrome P450 71AU50-like [Cryptomeria japonica]|uniref:cytochrome P450 71AU50-like n=1 Tax=Cryptomeria japonica TaxID=3369 RepID=UPI0027DAA248|nr:cytochrome P450 71AU50-like [Cryptomeria japonica]
MGGRAFKEVLDDCLALAGGFNYSDYIPLLGCLDFQGNRRRQAKLTGIFHLFVEKIVDEHFGKRKECRDLECEDFDLLSAATDTSGGTLEWAMSELLRDSSSMMSVQHEIDSTVGFNRMVEESDLPRLQYLQAIVKETLRLHPPAPLLIPHLSMEQSTIEGYQIPKMTQVLVNAWAIARDPISWEEANTFKPERFIGTPIDVKGQKTPIDVKGQNFELIPFGSGRRGCPGINLDLSIVHLGLAQLLHCFNWSLPKGTTFENLDMSEVYGLTMPRAMHLHTIPIPRLPLRLYEQKA